MIRGTETTQRKIGDRVEAKEDAALYIRDNGFRPNMLDSVRRIAEASVNRAWDEAARAFGFRNTLHALKEGFAFRLHQETGEFELTEAPEPPND